MPIEMTGQSGRRTSHKAKPKPEPTSMGVAQREEAVNGLFQMATFGCIMGKQFPDAGAIAKHGPNISHEVANLAETQPQVAKVVDYLTQAGPYAALITAVMPLALQLAANHKVIPADKLGMAGVVPPEMLQAEIQAELAQQQAEAMKRAQEAEQKLFDQMTAQQEMADMARPADERAFINEDGDEPPNVA